MKEIDEAGEALLGRVRIVLSHTTKPGNIGAAVRAMKTMGLRRLLLVRPAQFPHREATFMAAGAADMLDRVEVCDTLDEALHGAALAIALSARRRDLSPVLIDVREAAQAAVSEAAAGADVAFVFGTEISGLSNDEVLRCQRVARIGTSARFSSLNLAASVQVVAHETRYAALGNRARYDSRTPLATHEEKEHFFAALQASLERSAFIDRDKSGRVMERLRRLFGRAMLESQEVNVLRGMLNAWDEAMRKEP
ncbi:MAG: RNA methyltransferase [Burkholderiales bacterium]|nr:RNA methyltransferase [Burkholderiales bacterium]